MSAPSGSESGIEDEARAYERLKPRLAALWKEVFPRDDLAYTSVIVPLVTVEAEALARRFLSEGAIDPDTGLFTTPTGRSKFYRATDHLRSPAYRGLGPEDLIDIATMNGLNYSHHTESGTLFYMLGALSEHGRVGMVAIGNSREETGKPVPSTRIAHAGNPRGCSGLALRA